MSPTLSQADLPTTPSTHTAPTKRSARIIAWVLLGALALFVFIALVANFGPR